MKFTLRYLTKAETQTRKPVYVTGHVENRLSEERSLGLESWLESLLEPLLGVSVSTIIRSAFVLTG